MNNNIWFNYAPPGQQAYQGKTGGGNVNVNQNTNTNVSSNNPTKGGGTTGNVVYTYCTKCDNGAAKGNRVTNGDCTTLGPGWMDADPQNQGIWIDPCFVQPKSGCTDPLADNFDVMAVTDDGSCTYGAMGTSITCYKCVNGSAIGASYINTLSCPPGETTDTDPCQTGRGPALQDDCYECQSQTQYRVARGGCPDSPQVTVSPVDSNGSSRNPCPASQPGCTDPTALNYDQLANFDDGSCVPVVDGCMDATANNYNPNANVDDGLCTYDDDEELELEVEEIDDEIKTAGMAGNNKMLMYIAIGIGVLILLKK